MSSTIVEWFDTEQRLHTTVIDNCGDHRLIPFKLRKMYPRGKVQFNKVKTIDGKPANGQQHHTDPPTD